MNILSAANFFSEAFTWFANLSSKLPQIDYRTFFIVVLALLVGVGVIVGLTFFGSYRFKLTVACKKIIRYLKGVEFIDDDNFGDFTAQCFSAKAPSALRDSWVQYLGVRFGYPSDIVSEQNVYDSQVKRVREIRANVYIAIALVLVAVFAFWGYGTLDGNDMGVIFLAGLLISGVVYLALVILNRFISKTCLETFGRMQEELDAKVNLQVEKSFATDSSPLADLAAIIDEIVARNTAKEIGFEFTDGITPIEELIASAPEGENEKLADGSDEVDYINTISEAVEDDIQEEPTHSDENEDEEVLQDEEGQFDEEYDVIDDFERVEDEQTFEQPQEENLILQEEVAESEALHEDIEVFVEAEKQEEIAESLDGDEEDLQEDLQDEDSEAAPLEEQEEIIAEESAQPIEDEETADENAAEPEEEIDIDESAKKPEEETESDVEEPVEESAAEEEIVEEETAEIEAVEEIEEENPIDNERQSDEDGEKPEGENEGFSAPAEEEPEAGDGSNENDDDKAQEEPEVRYIVDGPTEDEEIVKPAKLVKLPNLVDYMLAQNLSRKVKINMATLLLSSYKKFENSKEDRAIIIGCMKKLMFDLQTKK